MASALVLNASFEPLGIVSHRRALLLVLNEKAESLRVTGQLFHSEHAVFELPSVVRLLKYVKVPYHAGTSLNRRAVFVRDGGRCQYCNAAAESIDHVVPRSRGGGHTWDNVVAACRSCNGRKRDRLLEETNFVLRTKPVRPAHRSWLIASGLASNPDWNEYLQSSTAEDVSA